MILGAASAAGLPPSVSESPNIDQIIEYRKQGYVGGRFMPFYQYTRELPVGVRFSSKGHMSLTSLPLLLALTSLNYFVKQHKPPAPNTRLISFIFVMHEEAKVLIRCCDSVRPAHFIPEYTKNVVVQDTSNEWLAQRWRCKPATLIGNYHP